MKFYLIFLFFLKIVLLVLTAMVFLGIIPLDNNVYLLVNNLLKFSLGLFIIYYFTKNKLDNIDYHDKLFIILGGFFLLFPNQISNSS